MTTDKRQPAELSPTERFNTLNEVFGTRPLARMMRVRPAHLLNFSTGAAALGPRRLQRLDFLYTVVSGLSASYNALGVNEWFDKPRKLLGHQSARGALEAYPWLSSDRDPRRIASLAKSLSVTPEA